MWLAITWASVAMTMEVFCELFPRDGDLQLKGIRVYKTLEQKRLQSRLIPRTSGQDERLQKRKDGVIKSIKM